MITTNSAIPFLDLGGTGELLHFAHANGFPIGSYQRLLTLFVEKYKVIGMHHRPLWQAEPNDNINWHTITEDLIQFLDAQGAKNIIGMGHSMGAAATMLAAAQRPDLFRKIILIEPVFLVNWWMLMFQLLPKSLKNKMNPMIKGALRRRDKWADEQEVFESWRKKRVFSRFSDKTLQDLVDAAIIPNGKGRVTLAYSKYWEAHFYGSIPSNIWSEMKKVKIPVMGIRGENSNTLFPNAWAKWKKIQPNGVFLEVQNTGHLVPMEQPEFLAKEIQQFIED